MIEWSDIDEPVSYCWLEVRSIDQRTRWIWPNKAQVIDPISTPTSLSMLLLSMLLDTGLGKCYLKMMLAET